MSINKNVEAKLSNILVSDTSDKVIAYANNIYQETVPTLLRNKHMQNEINDYIAGSLVDIGTWRSGIDSAIGADSTAGSIKGRIKSIENAIGTDNTSGTVKGRIKTIENLLSNNGLPPETVDTFEEIRDFLDEYTSEIDLATLLNNINSNTVKYTATAKANHNYVMVHNKTTANYSVSLTFNYLQSTFTNTEGVQIPPVSGNNGCIWRYKLNTNSSFTNLNSTSPVSTSVVSTFGKRIFNFEAVKLDGTGEEITNTKSTATVTVYKQLPIYVGFSADDPINFNDGSPSTNETNPTTSSARYLFGSSAGGSLTVTVPQAGTGMKKVYLIVPKHMTLLETNNKLNNGVVTQPDGMNMNFEMVKMMATSTNEKILAGTLGGKTYAYKVYESVLPIDGSVSKRLTIKIDSQDWNYNYNN